VLRETSATTDGGGRWGAPRMLSPSRFSDDVFAFSDNESYSLCPPRLRGTGLFDLSDADCGGVARPFLSDERVRVDDLPWSAELLRCEIDFRD
jgi:hypothetical protein